MYDTVQKTHQFILLRSTGNAFDVTSYRRLSRPRAPQYYGQVYTSGCLLSFTKPSSPGSGSFCFCVRQLRGHTGGTCFFNVPVISAQQSNLLPNVPTGRTMAVGWPRMSVHPRTVFGTYIRISSMYLATWLCMEFERVDGSVVTISLLCIFRERYLNRFSLPYKIRRILSHDLQYTWLIVTN